MVLEQCTVSRKTPLDGKLAISAAAAARLLALGESFPLSVAGQPADGRVADMTCTCEKAGGVAHVHHFIESPILRTLHEGDRLTLDVAGQDVTLSRLG